MLNVWLLTKTPRHQNQNECTAVIFPCYRCVTTANILLQVIVDSVTGGDDSLSMSNGPKNGPLVNFVTILVTYIK